MSWTPNLAITSEALELLRQAEQPSAEVQQRVLEGVEKIRALPDGCNYLVLILADATDETPQLRQRVGLVLKSILSLTNVAIPAQSLAYVKQHVLQALADPNVDVRKTAGTVISAIVSRYGSDSYPEALQCLSQLLRHSDPQIQASSLGAFGKIIEDELAARQLEFDLQASGTAESQFVRLSKDELLPQLLQYARSASSAELKGRALEVLNMYNSHHAFAFGEFAAEYFAPFWEALGLLASQDERGIRKPIVEAMVTILDFNAEAIYANSGPVLGFLYGCCGDEQYEVRLAALAFWPALLRHRSDDVLEKLRPLLPKLLPCLVENTRYTEWDFMQMDADQFQDDTSNIPDVSSQMMPRFHQSKVAAAGGGGEDDDDDGDNPQFTKSAWGNSWTARKAAALALDHLAGVFKMEALPIILPLIEARLQDTSDWQIRESGVLSLGAVTKGCLVELAPFAPRVVELLGSLCDDPIPLLRSISCWCLARFGGWMCFPENVYAYFTPGVKKLLTHILDRNKCVQEAACSALASLEEEAGSLMLPLAPEVFSVFGRAFTFYQAKNELILYDAIGTYAEAVGPALREVPPSHLALVTEPLLMNWSAVQLSDYQLIAICECLGCLVQALGSAIAPMAPAILSKCKHLLLTAINQSETADEEPTHDTAESVLDLISYLTENVAGASPEFCAAMQNEQVMGLVERIVMDPKLSAHINVNQSAFALIGDAAQWCPNALRPHLSVLVPRLATNIVASSGWAVASNASWAIGQIVEQVDRQVMEPYADFLVQQLVAVCVNRFANRSLRQNICITMGRLAAVCPDKVGERLPQALGAWCILMAQSKAMEEKNKAMKGICAALHTNPAAIRSNVSFLLDCVAAFYILQDAVKPPPPGSPVATPTGGAGETSPRFAAVPPDLDQLLVQLVPFIQQTAEAAEWTAAVARLPPTTQQFYSLKFFASS